jgi:hypothetical protein
LNTVAHSSEAGTLSEVHVTAPPPSGKPAKPYPDFSLFPYAAGVWAKKIHGNLH